MRGGKYRGTMRKVPSLVDLLALRLIFVRESADSAQGVVRRTRGGIQPTDNNNHERGVAVARVGAEDTKRGSSEQSDKVVKSSFNLGGLLGGLGGFIEKLGELAEAGERISRSGEFQDASGKIHGVYGINVKTALGEGGQTELKIEPFGNVHRGSENRPKGEDVREPLVDIHEEDDHVLVLVELPGVAKESVSLEVADRLLKLSAQRGKTSYRKQVDLPEGCSQETMHWECSNGILQVRFRR
jgi:HSP20 family protein